MPGWHFNHVWVNLKLWVLRMLDDIFFARRGPSSLIIVRVQYNRTLKNTLSCIKETGPDVIKQYVFMLNSAKHEIFTANKYENANYFS